MAFDVNPRNSSSLSLSVQQIHSTIDERRMVIRRVCRRFKDSADYHPPLAQEWRSI